MKKQQQQDKNGEHRRTEDVPTDIDVKPTPVVVPKHAAVHTEVPMPSRLPAEDPLKQLQENGEVSCVDEPAIMEAVPMCLSVAVPAEDFTKQQVEDDWYMNVLADMDLIPMDVPIAEEDSCEAVAKD